MTNIEIGDAIRRKRKERGISQQELAELASLNYVTISKYESGKVEPGARALARIATALDVTTDELLGRTEEQEEDAEDIWQLRERLRRDPDFRLLFSAADKATPDHIRAAAQMLKALEPQEFSE
jgi:transcriptional regulator with XRE-family HTH domain